MGATVAPDRILKELSDLWVSLGKQGESEGGAGVLRACSMTLIVVAEESEDTSALGEVLAALMPEHPARTMIVRLRGAGGRSLDERVYAQCWMPFGQRRQICCEQIEITASDDALNDLAPVVLPLAVPDLPVVLWCRSARLLGMPEFAAIAAMADKVVVDSASMAVGASALIQVAKAAKQCTLLGDLAWTRLTRWRERLSQVFENCVCLEQLKTASEIRVTYGGSYEMPAWYMGAWVKNVLASAGVSAALRVAGEPGAGFLRVELIGTDLRVQLERRDNTLEIVVNDLVNRVNLPEPTDYLLIREEVGIIREDPVFQSSLETAASLAYAGEK